jgi:hypothetical protein
VHDKGYSFEKENRFIFREDFEKTSVDEVLQNWDDSKNSKGLSLSDDVPKGSSGKKSLMVTYVAGKDEGGIFLRTFRWAMRYCTRVFILNF